MTNSQPIDVTAQAYRRCSAVMSAPVKDEVVMMDVEAGQYYALNAVGARVWEMLDSPLSFDEIVCRLMQEYDAAEDLIRVEVAVFLTRLEAEGVIERA